MTFTHGSLISIYIIQIVYNVFNIHQDCKWLMPAIVICEIFRKDKYSNDGIFLLRSAEWAAGISFCVFSSGGNGIGLRGFTIMGRGNWMYLGKTLWGEMAPMDFWLVSFIYAWYSHDYVCNIETMELFNTGGISKGGVYAACMCVYGYVYTKTNARPWVFVESKVCVLWVCLLLLHVCSVSSCYVQFINVILSDSKVRGANMGPIWGWHEAGGPHVSPLNFAIWFHKNGNASQMTSSITDPTIKFRGNGRS